MYAFEGHHPNEPTYLRQPPSPYQGRDLCLERKIREWGPIRVE